MRVLVVDDDAVNREVASSFLEWWGVEHVLAADGAEAVRLFGGDREFDLVLMDLQMPVMDGLAASKAIRELEPARPGRRVPIVACTCAFLVDEGADVDQHGLDAVLAKPYSVDDLAACLAHWCPNKFQSN
jgi:CheY-like chemotaxis protein